jgi:hypothetical protein
MGCAHGTRNIHYVSVAEDRAKLERERSGGFQGDLFLVVFFVQMPAFDYPRGLWSGRDRESCCRKDWLVKSGIASQYEELSRRLTAPPAWPNDGPRVRRLIVPNIEQFRSDGVGIGVNKRDMLRSSLRLRYNSYVRTGRESWQISKPSC